MLDLEFEGFDQFEYPWMAKLTALGGAAFALAFVLTVVAVALGGLGVPGILPAVVPVVGALALLGVAVFAVVTVLLVGVLLVRFYRGKPTLSAVVRTGSDDDGEDEGTAGTGRKG